MRALIYKYTHLHACTHILAHKNSFAHSRTHTHSYIACMYMSQAGRTRARVCVYVCVGSIHYKKYNPNIPHTLLQSVVHSGRITGKPRGAWPHLVVLMAPLVLMIFRGSGRPQNGPSRAAKQHP